MSVPHPCWKTPAPLSGGHTGVQRPGCRAAAENPALHSAPSPCRAPSGPVSLAWAAPGIAPRQSWGAGAGRGQLVLGRLPRPRGSSASHVSFLLSAPGGGSQNHRMWCPERQHEEGCQSREHPRCSACPTSGLWDGEVLGLQRREGHTLPGRMWLQPAASVEARNQYRWFLALNSTSPD